MKFLGLIAIIAAAASSSVACAYQITHSSTLNCRNKPSTSGSIVKTYKTGDDLKISCQTFGTVIEGNNLWDKTQDGCYAADHYIKTGVNGFVTSACSGTNKNVPGVTGDDYKYKGNCGAVDKWNYYTCQCTSFVAQRINERLGVAFTNRYKGHAWGNANSWSAAAKASGVTINSTPKPGAIAQTTAGTYGHVAWVAAVNGNTVTLEEYK